MSRPYIVVISSIYPGVGKTTTINCLAQLLRAYGKTVLIEPYTVTDIIGDKSYQPAIGTMEKHFAYLRQADVDFVLIEMEAGINGFKENYISWCDYCVIVTDLESAFAIDTAAFANSLAHLDMPQRVLFSKVDRDESLESLTERRICRILLHDLGAQKSAVLETVIPEGRKQADLASNGVNGSASAPWLAYYRPLMMNILALSNQLASRK